jgi:hypothetical protein
LDPTGKGRKTKEEKKKATSQGSSRISYETLTINALFWRSPTFFFFFLILILFFRLD